MKNPKKIHLIVNPHGGAKSGLQMVDKIKPQFENANIEVCLHPTEYAGHSQEIIRTLRLQEGDVICGIGGDGTAYHLINGIMQREDARAITLGLIPGGTGNDLSFDIGGLTVNDAVTHIIEGKTRKIDLAHVKTETVSTYMGVCLTFGYIVSLTIFSEKLRFLGLSRYTVAGVIELFRHKGYQGKIILNDGEKVLEGEFSFFMAMNTRCSGKRVLTIPNGNISDGKCDLLVLKEQGKIALYKTLIDIQKGTIANNKLVSLHPFKKLEFIPNGKDDINVDGEWFEKSPVTCDVLADALTVFGV